MSQLVSMAFFIASYFPFFKNLSMMNFHKFICARILEARLHGCFYLLKKKVNFFYLSLCILN